MSRPSEAASPSVAAALAHAGYEAEAAAHASTDEAVAAASAWSPIGRYVAYVRTRCDECKHADDDGSESPPRHLDAGTHCTQVASQLAQLHESAIRFGGEYTDEETQRDFIERCGLSSNGRDANPALQRLCDYAVEQHALGTPITIVALTPTCMPGRRFREHRGSTRAGPDWLAADEALRLLRAAKARVVYVGALVHGYPMDSTREAPGWDALMETCHGISVAAFMHAQRTAQADSSASPTSASSSSSSKSARSGVVGSLLPPSTHQIVSGALGWLSSTATTLSTGLDNLADMVEEAMREEDGPTAAKSKNNITETPTPIDDHSSPSDDTATSSAYELTPALLEFVSALSEHEDTFLCFPKPTVSVSTFVMTNAQERCARELLQKSPSLGQCRFRLVPKKISESEFWRITFTLIAQFARKLAARDHYAIAEEPHCTCGVESTDGSAASAPPTDAIHPRTHDPSCPLSRTVVHSPVAISPRPARSALADDEIDRLCGTSNLQARPGSLASAAATHHDDDEHDEETDEYINEIMRRHRHGISHSFPSPAAALGASHRSTLSTASGGEADAINLSTDFNVTEEELDDAFEQVRIAEAEELAASSSNDEEPATDSPVLVAAPLTRVAVVEDLP